MKSKMNVKSILIMAIIGIISFFFINMSLAADTGKVNVETANLREKADDKSKILDLVSLNQEVEILEKSGDWYKVKAKGITGYLRQDLVKTNNEQTENNIQNNNTTTSTESQTTNSTEEQTEVNSQVQEQQDVNTEVQEQIATGKKIIAKNSKLKTLPIITASEISELKENDEVNCTEVLNGWAYIESNDSKGWIRKENLKNEKTESVQENKEEPKEEKTEEKEEQENKNEEAKTEQKTQTTKTMYVNTSSINLRTEANTKSGIVTTLPVNTAVEVIEEANGWCKVKVSGKEGYISASLLSDKKQETSRSIETPRKTEENKQTEKTEANNTNTQQQTTNTSSTSGSSVVEKAKSFIGSKYVYGGSSPNGFDCSGFTSYIYNQYGISLNRTAAGQNSNGTAVDRGNLQPGDLVLFGKSGINHVGIYVGNGQIVHAANASRGVTTDTINSGYYNTNYVGARRVIN